MAKEVPLKELCRDPEVNMEPRQARMILRKHAEKLGHSNKQRWSWEQDQLAAIKLILKEKDNESL